MNYAMLCVGNSTYILAVKVAVIIKFKSVRIKKEITGLREGESVGRLVDATKHKAIKSVVILENGTCVLSNLIPETLVKRLADLTEGDNEKE